MKKLKNIINNFIKDWKESIHVLADFDRTLTKAFYNWEKRPSIISVLRREWYLWEDYSKKAYELYDKYHPVEIDPNIDLEVKKEKMLEWRNAHLDLLVKSKLHKKDINKVVNSWIIKLRDWIKEFLEKLNKNNIPLIIISANWLWGDSIKLYLESHNLYLPNIHIISNNFIFDNKWNVIWYDEKIIHVFNKDETVIHDYPNIYEKIKNRKNVILLWDSIWDVWMIKGFEYDNIIKIWFLNENTNELLTHYQEIYDIVSTWDWDVKFLNELLNEINK
jgi:5'-nucleotidase